MRACVHVRMCAYMCVLKASLVVSYPERPKKIKMCFYFPKEGEESTLIQ